MTLARRLLLVLASALAFAGTAAGAQPPAAPLSVVSFNVLAPVWAAPDWYPSQMDMSLLDTAYRRDRISAFLAAKAAVTDVFCLQEVQDSELPHFLAALGPGFDGLYGSERSRLVVQLARAGDSVGTERHCGDHQPEEIRK